MKAADVCTPESHEADKRAFAPTLEYKGDQLDEHGQLELIYLHCLLCDSTLAVPVSNHQRAPGESRYASTNRRPAMAPPAESGGPVGSAPPDITSTAGVVPRSARGPASVPARRIVTVASIDHVGNQLAADVALGRRLELDNDNSDRVVAEQLGALIASRHGLVDIAIFTENRQPEVVAARRDLCKVLRGMEWSLPRIGRSLDRHHTSVLSLLRSDVATSSPA